MVKRDCADIGETAVLAVVAIVAEHPYRVPSGTVTGPYGWYMGPRMYVSSIGVPLITRVRLRISTTSPGTPITRLMNFAAGILGIRKDDDLPPLRRPKPIRHLVDQQPLAIVQAGLHRVALDQEGLGDEEDDEERQSDGDDEGLGVLRESPI